MIDNYQTKYLKYKFKYLNLLNQSGGYEKEEFEKILNNPDENGYLMEIDKDKLLIDSISLSKIHKNNAIYIDKGIHDANSLSESIERYYLNNKKLATNPLNRNEYTEKDYNLIADHISGSGLDEELINKRKEIINEIKNLIQLDNDIQKEILDLKPEQRKIFLSDEKFKIFINFFKDTQIKLIYTNLLDNRNFQNIDDFEKYLYEKFIKNIELLFLFPEEYMTDNICELAVRYSGFALKYVPKNKITNEIIELAVNNNGLALEYVIPDTITPKEYLEICKLAVNNNGNALEYVIPDTITPKEYLEICKLAVNNNGIALKYVVPDTITPKEYLDICLLAVDKRYKALEYVLADEMTPIQYYYICEIVVYKKYNAFEYVKANKMTIEEYFYICDLAFRHNSLLLQHVPYDLRTFKMCKLAIEYDSDALQYVSSGRMTPEEYLKICMIAVEKNGNALQYIYDIRMTSIEYSEICKIAVCYSGRALEYIPTNKKTFEICKLAVQKDSYALQFVPKENMTIEEYLEICKLAVQKNGCSLRYVHNEIITKTIIEEALANNKDALKFVPDKFK